ncbi:RagB/SusD family nutrient uptake outer membrane protein [Zobellia galactanivorans]|uniref:SusD/RagB family lipoprotein n=1 Tax=Zobellia galactanivorans (strain DSM 12802 / CCUG 47099 / CIP 106680 / NCIMB 13871 / Dsij) TaxID=63186 RepID=G0L8A4_ZOBGA|nr:RagB/SusD family nutrient uptake outer membrane protein [Zobellia galactanivorans]CAZ98073.1 SusD/RagB family lipoprotein [Zobellia galactanivorans]
MKKLYNYIILVVLLISGCTKDLDLYPLDSISDATFWETADDFKLASNNLYYSLSQQKIEADVESEIAYFTDNSISNGTYVVSDTDDKWNTPYTYIRQCNKIFAEAENSGKLEDADVKRFVAEAKFFRAWNYWMLFRLYGGVPLIKDVPDIDSEGLYDARATRKETVDFMLQDLTDATLDLPLKSSLASADVGRITKGAALSLKARIALFEGTWGKYHGTGDGGYLDVAIASASEVIDSNEFSLFTGKGAESYRYLFIEEGDDSPESILDSRYEVNVRGQNFSDRILGGEYIPTKKLADEYLCTDGLPIDKSDDFNGYDTRTSEYENRDPRMEMTFVRPGSSVVWSLFPEPIESWPFFPSRNGNTGYMTNKYRSENEFGNTTQQNQFGWDTHVIRYAEVLLIYAEALYEKNGSISDIDLDKSINVIRDRVGMLPLKNTFVSSNGLDMKEEIRRERTVELALEGYRYDDLRRWKIAEEVLPQTVLGIKIVGSQWGTDPIIINDDDKNIYLKEDYQSRTDANGFLIVEPSERRYFDEGKHYLRPLPTREININPKLEQNPGW